MQRDDLSDRLIHLTRGENARDAFSSIVDQRKLIGGAGYIRGNYRCVCFTEAPVSKLAFVLAKAIASEMRYQPFGVMVPKKWLFEKGARPVIYQPESEFELLNEVQKYRHVRFEPTSGTDFTWEREWRLCAAELELDTNFATLVVPTRSWEQYFQQRHEAMLQRRALVSHGIGPASVSRFPWHFIVLEDLGVEFDSTPVPPN